VLLEPRSLEEVSLSVPAEQRARFLGRARQLTERARASQASPLELELSLCVLSVLCGATTPGARGSDS
jgi:hypothetical protein